MIWLTNEERAENQRRNEESRRRGYSSHHDEMRRNEDRVTDELAARARSRLTVEEYEALCSQIRRGVR